MNLARNQSKDLLLKHQKSAQAYFSNDPDDKEKKCLGISGSTFRSYRNLPKRPSIVYKEWAKKEIDRIEKLTSINNSREGFLKLHSKLTEGLEKIWPGTLTVAQKFKIIDLFIKYMSRASKNRELKEFFMRHGNIPLDKYTLTVIGEVFYGIVIAPSPSMGHIRDVKTYSFLQDQIYSFTQSTGVPNLYFDHFALSQRE